MLLMLKSIHLNELAILVLVSNTNMNELLFFLTGLIVGGMNAVAGGGMLIGFPVMVALGVPPLVANITGNIITAPGQLASAWAYRNYLKRVPWSFALLAIPLLLGGAAGAIVLRQTSANDFAKIVPGLVFFGVALFTVQPLLHFHLRQHLRGKHRTLIPLLFIALAMLPLSFYGGYFGAGFGFMMLAFLSFAHLPDLHMMNAMKNVGATLVSGVSLLCLYSTGHVDWKVGGIMATGAVIGGYSGARGSQRISSRWLRIGVIVVGFAAVAYLALQRY
jgi:uncharacterized membrane protein YfcA